MTPEIDAALNEINFTNVFKADPYCARRLRTVIEEIGDDIYPQATIGQCVQSETS
jgi:hypothetical protein